MKSHFLLFTLFTAFLPITSKAAESPTMNYVDSLVSNESWAEMERGTFPRQDDPIIKVMQRLCREEPGFVRNVIRKLLELGDDNTTPGNPVNKWSFVYLINRFYCHVPDWETVKDRRLFGGWVGIPEDDSRFKLGYPLVFNPDGTIELEGPLGGYTGAAYQGLNEFDFLLEKYGRRKVKAK